MANSVQSRSFQMYNSNNARTCSSLPRLKSIDETKPFSSIPYSSIGTTQATIQPLASSPDKVRAMPMAPKRRSSTVILNNLLSSRKSLQTTALATRRQSLWMSIAKTEAPINEPQFTPLTLLQQNNNLIRKKALRLLLVFSYLISISLLAIALATFYGFFWSGYGQIQTTTIPDAQTTAESLVSSTSNSTLANSETELEDVT